jgi:hypothetical protein
VKLPPTEKKFLPVKAVAEAYGGQQWSESKRDDPRPILQLHFKGLLSVR